MLEDFHPFWVQSVIPDLHHNHIFDCSFKRDQKLIKKTIMIKFQVICTGEYYEYHEELSNTFRPPWLTVPCALINLIISFRTYKRRRQIEKEEKAHQPNLQMNNKIPKSLESILLNSVFLVLISSGGRLCLQI